MIEVLVLLSHKNQVSVPTLLFAKNMKAEMTICIAQPLFFLSTVVLFLKWGILSYWCLEQIF